MKLMFPSREFDEAVAAVCHGSPSDEQTQALNGLLCDNVAARDEYILRLELHTRLMSEPNLFVSVEAPALFGGSQPEARGADSQSALRPCGSHSRIFNPQPLDRSCALEPSGVPPNGIRRNGRFKICAAPQGAIRQRRVLSWAVPLAAGFALLTAGWWGLQHWRSTERKGTISNAVAVLNRAVEAQWNERGKPPRLGAPLEPGWLRLKSGLAQIVFYSGARVVIEGPAELEIISPNEASCGKGRLTAEVPPPARGFRIGTPLATVTDLGTSFGLDVQNRRTELHVFKGSVEWQEGAGTATQNVPEGEGVVVEPARPPRRIAANPAAFASLFELQARSLAAEAQRYDQWRAASRRLNQDPSLLVHFDFEHTAATDWRLPNVSGRGTTISDATIVGGQWTEGRWPDKWALEFQNVSDRVRLSVPGEFEALTLAAWVRVQGLDRRFNSLFMCDSSEPGAIHWLIRNDGALGLTVNGAGSGNFQILASPPVLTLDRLGLWVQLAVVLDGRTGRVVHYVNGLPVGEQAVRIKPPYRISKAELGNWDARGFPENDPSTIRNFSGAMDEFCLFSRALSGDEIRALYGEGKPQLEPLAQNRNAAGKDRE